MRRGASGRALARGLVGIAIVVAVTWPAGVAAAPDPVVKCRRAVVQGAVKLARARLVALRKCEDAKRAGKRPDVAVCVAEADVVATFAAARAKLAAVVDRACGGADGQCGGSDDLTLAQMGWPSLCPEIEGHGCGAPVAGCADVPACVACLADAAATRELDLIYAPLQLVDRKTQKAIAGCQKALTAAAASLADKRLAVHARCLVQRLDGKHDAPCPLPGDGKAAAMLTAARAKAEAKVCKACGGPDKRCGGGDDLALAVIGTSPGCPGVGMCSTDLAGIADLVQCLDCTSAARSDCVLAGAAPGVAVYPALCAVVPSTPTPTTTPTPTLTPSATPTLSPTPTPTATPMFCAAEQAGTVTTAVTITLVSDAPIGGASMLLDYLPGRVRLPAAGGDAPVRARVTDLTGGALLDGKGAPNNQDTDADFEPDRVRFTLVAEDGVTGLLLRVTFDRCAGAVPTTGTDFVCTIEATTAVAPDGVTPVVGATCAVAVVHAP